ncbi:MAG TPA: 23S rRNA pseudouridine(1911/1915/1917) synthase RluD [Gammaproteobacteria bacterium]|nr:23S rRNA pseudouridine(1911/1915/1917) synthase RluD [Gammaproteobacteria bacterium]
MSPEKENRQILSATVPLSVAGRRLDQALAALFPAYSRSRLQQWIKAGRVTVNGRVLRGRARLSGGERVVVEVVAEQAVSWQAQSLPLAVVYEDDSLLVINKPPGVVVHPAAGNWDGTLVNALLHHAPELERLPRAGVVHRLDKDTSGLLVVARTLAAQKSLVAQLQARTVSREYAAVVVGALVAGGTVDAPIGRHPVDRKRMAVVPRGKPAISHYRVQGRFRAHTHIAVRLETGRTHQIRVHLAHIRHPLVGDATYGGRARLPSGAGDALIQALRGFPRQALHARRLALRHPRRGEPVSWEAPLPDDICQLLAALKADTDAQA